MPHKHAKPQQNPQHSTETAKSGYAVTHTRRSSENSDLPADAISASSRMQNYLRDKRGWMNIIVVAHMQFFCCVLSAAFVNSYGWIPVISALCSTTALYFRYRFPYGSIYVIIAALCLTLVTPFPDSLAITCYPPVSPAAPASAASFSAGSAHSPSPCSPRSRSSIAGTTYPPASSSP